MTRRFDVALAAGGTGGHLFPATALARILRARGIGATLLTDARGMAYTGDVPTLQVPTAMPTGSLVARLTAVPMLAAGIATAARLLIASHARCVVGFGGYPAAPTMLAARLLGRPLVVHEQNALLGRANRLVAGAASRIATSFPETAGIATPLADRVTRVGMPVRDGIAALGGRSYAPPDVDTTFRLLVFGGSQGARVMSDVVPPALARLDERHRRRLDVVQQARPEDLERTRAAYHDAGIAADVRPFLDDMADRLDAAHLVVARAGASTVAELLVAGRPALLVPYPHAAEDHQALNAEALERIGAAWAIRQPSFTAEDLATRVAALMDDPAPLADVAAAARAAASPNAADTLAEVVLEVLEAGRTGTCPVARSIAT